jgi:hypothetical protein
VAHAVVMDVDIVLTLQNMLKERWLCQKNYLNSLIIILTMEPNKIHERVLEIQKNMPEASPEQQTAMLGELFELVSKVEQSLSEIKIESDDEE